MLAVQSSHHANAHPIAELQGEARKREGERDAMGCASGAGNAGDGAGSNHEPSRPSLQGEAREKPRSVAVQQSIRRYGATTAYWGRQGGDAMCAMHTINSLLQRHAVDSDYLHAVSARLDAEENRLLGGPPEKMVESNARPDGDHGTGYSECITKARRGLVAHGHKKPRGA